MATYYVGSGGSDAGAGTSWPTRKLTLQGAVNAATSAGDWIWAAPGAYRELVTLVSSGSSGNPITIAGDIDGSHTSGEAGPVRITGSNNDTSVTRVNCLTADSISYITLRRLTFEAASTDLLYLQGAVSNWIIEQCKLSDVVFFQHGVRIYNFGEAANITIRRCLFLGCEAVIIDAPSGVQNSGILIESNIVQGFSLPTVYAVGGITVRNNSIFGGDDQGCIICNSMPPTGYTQWQVRNNLLISGWDHFSAPSTALMSENYNCTTNPFSGTHRSGVSAGANTLVDIPPLLDVPRKVPGKRDLTFLYARPRPNRSKLVAAGTAANMATYDFYGRPFANPPSIGAVEGTDV